MDFRLPPLGEGIDSATVVMVAVKPGDSVTPGQTLIEVETDKTNVPVTATWAGTVEHLNVKQGDKITVGAVVASISGGPAVAASKPAAPPRATTAPSPAPAPAAKAAPAPLSQSINGTGGTTRLEFRLPPLGEGIESGVVVNLVASAGSTVSFQQTLFEIETDKTNVPIPAPAAGVLEELRVKVGDKVTVGSVVAVITTQGATAAAKVEAARPATVASPEKPIPSAVSPTRPEVATVAMSGGSTADVPAGPATRRLARKLGVDLRQVPGSGRGGRVTVDDIETYVKSRLTGAPLPATAPSVSASGIVAPPLPDFTRFGPVERKPMSTLRKKIAENLTISVLTAPAVTQYDVADITDLEAGRKRYVDSQPKGTPKVTMTILALKAVVAALKAYPQFNSAYDAPAGELVLKQYFHIGIAVDTERGLVVPVIRDVDKKSIQQLAREVTDVAGRARDNKLTPEDMSRGLGCFTISNLGGIGGTAFSPIINYPEVAILGMARSSLQPVVRENGTIEARLMLPLCLTYDHRVIDGADGARFVTYLSKLFADPVRLLMEA